MKEAKNIIIAHKRWMSLPLKKRLERIKADIEKTSYLIGRTEEETNNILSNISDLMISP